MNIGEVKSFWQKIYDSRYFWMHLAKTDLRNRFRRSKLGILWVCVTPLSLMAIMTVIFGVVFKQDMKTYAPYILSGLLVWNIISDSFMTGWASIIGNDPYIRQFNHPIVIYPLKGAIASIVGFLISMISLVIIEAINLNFYNIIIGIVSLPITVLIYFAFDWCGTIIASYIGTRYRDYPQLIGLILQAIWYVSPVFFQESMFESNRYLYTFFLVNPLTHILKLIRNPFLEGEFPSIENYIVSILMVILLAIIAFFYNRKYSKDIIFYI